MFNRQGGGVWNRQVRQPLVKCIMQAELPLDEQLQEHDRRKSLGCAANPIVKIGGHGLLCRQIGKSSGVELRCPICIDTIDKGTWQSSLNKTLAFSLKWMH